MNERHEQHEQRSNALLDIALDSVRVYEPWRARDPGRTSSVHSRYASMPLVNKAVMRQHGPDAFILPGLDYERALQDGTIELVSTSGTTEECIQNVWFQPWWDFSERASWKLNAHTAGIDGTQREAILTGPLQTGFPCEHGTLTMAQRTRGRFLYLNEKLSPDLWTPEIMERMLDELAEFQPVTLEANPSLIATLARYASAKGRAVYQPRVIILTYENPSALHRRAIARVFSAPVASSYGATETGYVFMECECGTLHQVVDSCRVEIEPLAADYADERTGRILVTTFGNPWRVLLRFDIGDLGRVRTEPCACGRCAGVMLESIDGRTNNLTFGRNGRGVSAGAVDRTLAGVPGLAEYQLNQERVGECVLLAVAEQGAEHGQLWRDCRDALEKLYIGGISCDARIVGSFPPEVSGKYRLVKSSVRYDIDAQFVRGASV